MSQAATLCWNGSDKVVRLSIQDSVKVSLKSYVVFTYPEDILILMLDYEKNTKLNYRLIPTTEWNLDA